MKTFLTTILCWLMLIGSSYGATTISALPAKNTLDNADPFIIDDVAANTTKKVLWSTIKSQIQAANLFQPLDPDLTALAAIGTALTNNLMGIPAGALGGEVAFFATPTALDTSRFLVYGGAGHLYLGSTNYVISGPILRLSGGWPAALPNTIGLIDGYGWDTTTNQVQYGLMAFQEEVATDTAEVGAITFRTMVAGVLEDILRLGRTNYFYTPVVIVATNYNGIANLGVNSQNPASVVEVRVTNNPSFSPTFGTPIIGTDKSVTQVSIVSTNDQAAGRGAGLGLGGSITNTATADQLDSLLKMFAAIYAAKEDAGVGNTDGYFSIYTARTNALVEQVRISTNKTKWAAGMTSYMDVLDVTNLTVHGTLTSTNIAATYQNVTNSYASTNDTLYLAPRTDGNPGDGSSDNPFDASTAAKFDAVLWQHLQTAGTSNKTFRLMPGTYYTAGQGDFGATYGWYANSNSLNIAIIGDGSESTRIVMTNATTQTGAYAGFVIDSGNQNWLLQGFTLDMGTYMSVSGANGRISAVYFKGGTNIVMRDLVGINTEGGTAANTIFQVAFNYDVAGNKGRNVLIENVQVRNVTSGKKNGIGSTADFTRVEKCYVDLSGSGAGSIGIGLGGDGSLYYGNTVTNATEAMASDTGVFRDFIISGNYLHGSSAGIDLAPAASQSISNVVIIGNTINCAGYGIIMQRTGDGVVRDVQVSGNSFPAISASGAINFSFVTNAIVRDNWFAAGNSLTTANGAGESFWNQYYDGSLVTSSVSNSIVTGTLQVLGSAIGQTATLSNQFVTLAQLEGAAQGGMVEYFDTTPASAAAGFTPTGTVKATNYMTSVAVPTLWTNAEVTAANGDYIAKFITTNTFSSLPSGRAVIEVYVFDDSPGGGAISAEVYIINSVTKAEEYEFTPAPEYQTVPTGGTPTKLQFSTPISDYTSTTNFHLAVKLKVQESSTPDPTIRVVTGGAFSSHVSFTISSTSLVLKSGDTMTGALAVPTEAYGAGWNADATVPTKGDLYTKIESMSAASGDTVYVNAVRATNPNIQTNTQIHAEYGGAGGTNIILRIADGAPITNANLLGTTSVTTMNAGDVVFTNPVTRLNWISGAGDSLVITNKLTNNVLVASKPVFTAADKSLVSVNANGTGEVMLTQNSTATNLTATALDVTGGLTNSSLSASLPVFTSATKYLTNVGTIDAASAGIVLKQTKHLYLINPSYGDGAGAIPQTNNYTTSGLMHYTMSGTAETNVNWIVYECVVPPDIDTGVAMTAAFAFVSGGTDADDVTVHISYALGAAGAALSTGTSIATSPITVTVTPTTPASGDVQKTAATTLTGWAAAMTAGTPLLIRVARLNNNNDDSLRDMFLDIAYGSTQ